MHSTPDKRKSLFWSVLDVFYSNSDTGSGCDGCGGGECVSLFIKFNFKLYNSRTF